MSKYVKEKSELLLGATAIKGVETSSRRMRAIMEGLLDDLGDSASAKDLRKLSELTARLIVQKRKEAEQQKNSK